MGFSLILLLLILLKHSFPVANSSFHSPKCHSDESSALIQFKKSFSDCPESWNESTNCCGWSGVTCERVTGHVVGLSVSLVRGVISSNSSLFSLRHLRNLEITDSDFLGSDISPKFGDFVHLTRLAISNSNFSGHLPFEIARLSKLVSFNIRQFFDIKIKISPTTFQALVGNWSEMRELNLGGADLSSVPSPLLRNLSSSLEYLDLSRCNLQGEFPENIFRLRYLLELRLRENQIVGSLPKSNWTSQLLSLEISDTKISVDLPYLLKNARSLSDLLLSNSHLVGSSLIYCSNFSRLETLDISYNNFSGHIPWSSLNCLKNLRNLDLSSNNFFGEVPKFRVNSFGNDFSSKLYSLLLSDNLLYGTVPAWIYSGSSLQVLDLSSNSFTGKIGFKEHSTSPLDHLSQNQSHGNLPEWPSRFNNLQILNLSHNLFTHIEVVPFMNLLFFDITSNFFSGPLPVFLSSKLSIFSVSKNQFSGEIPDSICNFTSLWVLDVSFNNLSGVIPQCMGNFSEDLFDFDLRNNNLKGTIPTTFSRRNDLRTLYLNGNLLEGELPRSLENCRNLQALDLGNNLFEGAFPHWLESLPELRVLVLRANKFRGSIENPQTKSSFQKLRIMDISTNEFSESLPTKLFEHFEAMINSEEEQMRYMGDDFYKDSVMVTMKGFYLELEKILTIFTTIDFSGNNFSGSIPESIGRLRDLKGLNLSHNKLTRAIPSSLRNLTNLEWLDLSSNELVGGIPDDLADVTSLAFLNLSHNHLEGPIPQGKQFNTFSNDSYMGNLGLCGFPMTEKCTKDTDIKSTSPSQSPNQDADPSWFDWKTAAMGYASGLVIGISLGYMLLYSNGRLSWLCELMIFRILGR